MNLLALAAVLAPVGVFVLVERLKHRREARKPVEQKNREHREREEQRSNEAYWYGYNQARKHK